MWHFVFWAALCLFLTGLAISVYGTYKIIALEGAVGDAKDYRKAQDSIIVSIKEHCGNLSTFTTTTYGADKDKCLEAEGKGVAHGLVAKYCDGKLKVFRNSEPGGVIPESHSCDSLEKRFQTVRDNSDAVLLLSGNCMNPQKFNTSCLAAEESIGNKFKFVVCYQKFGIVPAQLVTGASVVGKDGEVIAPCLAH